MLRGRRRRLVSVGRSHYSVVPSSGAGERWPRTISRLNRRSEVSFGADHLLIPRQALSNAVVRPARRRDHGLRGEARRKQGDRLSIVPIGRVGQREITFRGLQERVFGNVRASGLERLFCTTQGALGDRDTCVRVFESVFVVCGLVSRHKRATRRGSAQAVRRYASRRA